jgi:hypothetical protein
VEEQAEFVRKMGSIVRGVVVLTNQFATKDEPDSVWQERVQKLLDLTPGFVCLSDNLEDFDIKEWFLK